MAALVAWASSVEQDTFLVGVGRLLVGVDPVGGRLLVGVDPVGGRFLVGVDPVGGRSAGGTARTEE